MAQKDSTARASSYNHNEKINSGLKAFQDTPYIVEIVELYSKLDKVSYIMSAKMVFINTLLFI